jgi:Membrane domain of glycerophosphoryl diester phosphodiesterase
LIAGVVGEVWRLFRARFWRTLIIVALLLAPLELLIAVLDPDFTSLAPGWWAWVGFTSAITLVAFPWVLGALVHDVAKGDRTATEAYVRTWDRLPDLVISTVVTTVGILLGTIALVVPGLILLARWALVVPLIVLERAPWRLALSRSNELVRGRTRTVITIFVLLTLIGLALVALPLAVGYLLLENVIGAWLATLAVDTVFIAFYAFAPFVLYRRLAA